VEKGTHDDLLANTDSQYSKMWTSQQADAAEALQAVGDDDGASSKGSVPRAASSQAAL